VIARNSAFAMRGRTVTDVGRELGARYVVEGSTRAQAEHVRIQVQVVDAENGEHVYAKRYDRELTDVFAVQDEIVEAIVGVLEPLLFRLEGLKALRKPPGSLGVWEQVQRGVSLLHTQAMADARVALEHFDRAIELDSTSAPAHAGRAAARLLVGMGRLGASHAVGGTAEELREALAEAVAGFVDAMTTGRRATELDPLDPNGFLALGGGLSLTGQNESALVAFERALALNPSSALVCFMAGNALAWGPRWQEAGELFERALRLSPHDPALHHVEGALAGFRFRQGRYEETLDLARRSREHEPQGAMSYRPFITASLAFLGRLDEARAECEAMRAYRPGWNGQLARFLGPAAAVDRLFEGIRLAGWEVPDPTGPTAGTSR
jgi:tetratricopeptide (TPR) repeat protein